MTVNRLPTIGLSRLDKPIKKISWKNGKERISFQYQRYQEEH